MNSYSTEQTRTVVIYCTKLACGDILQKGAYMTVYEALPGIAGDAESFFSIRRVSSPLYAVSVPQLKTSECHRVLSNC